MLFDVPLLTGRLGMMPVDGGLREHRYCVLMFGSILFIWRDTSILVGRVEVVGRRCGEVKDPTLIDFVLLLLIVRCPETIPHKFVTSNSKVLLKRPIGIRLSQEWSIEGFGYL